MPAPHIVILGSGFGGISVARRLEARLREGEASLTLVSRDNFTLFTPMLPEVSSGGIEKRHIVSPVRRQLRRTQYVLGQVERLDLDARSVEIRRTDAGMRKSLSYDHLVIALGGITSTFDIPGVAEHALGLKTIEDADRLRDHIVATLELADVTTDRIERRRLLAYVVVGGGYTGCEAAGELSDLFESIGKYYRSIDPEEVRIVLVEAGTKLLPDLPAGMGRYTMEHLSHQGVEIQIGDGVVGVDQLGIALRSGRRIESSTVIWSAGVRPAPVVSELPVEHARNGAVLTERDMQLGARPGVWALGDCARIPTAKDGTWYPPTAQHAIHEGAAVADNIIATLRGLPTKPFDFVALGTMASLGGRRGVVAFPNGLIVTGFPAWVLWRLYYLSRLPGVDRRLRVALDWMLDFFFPRELATFSSPS